MTLRLLAFAAIAIALIVAACGGGDGPTNVVMEYIAEGKAMEPTLFHDDQVKVREYGSGLPARGDVIVFKSPITPDSALERFFIKRVIGLPGETVEIRDGEVWIDGRPLDEAYILEPPAYTFGKDVVPPDHYFVLGDNRNNSSDSHTWGMLIGENIIGYAEDSG